MSLQESSTLPASLFQCFIVFLYKLDHFSDYLRQKMIDFVRKKQWNTKWRVGDLWSDVMACSGPRLSNSRSSSLSVADAGTLKHDFVAKIWRNQFLEILEIPKPKKQILPYIHFNVLWMSFCWCLGLLFLTLFFQFSSSISLRFFFCVVSVCNGFLWKIVIYFLDFCFGSWASFLLLKLFLLPDNFLYFFLSAF